MTRTLLIVLAVLASSRSVQAQPQACEAISHLASVGAEGTTWTSRVFCDVSLHGDTLRFAYPLPRGTRVLSAKQSLVLTRGAPTALVFDPRTRHTAMDLVLYTPARTGGPIHTLTPPLLDQDTQQLVALDDDERVFTPDASYAPERGRHAVVFVGAPHVSPSRRALAHLRTRGARGEVLVLRLTPELVARGGLQGVLETRSAHFRKTYVALALLTVLGLFVLVRVYRRLAGRVELEEAEAIIRADLEA